MQKLKRLLATVNRKFYTQLQGYATPPISNHTDLLIDGSDWFISVAETGLYHQILVPGCLS